MRLQDHQLLRSTSLTTIRFVVSIRVSVLFFEPVVHKIFERCFTRPFLFVRGWGLGIKLRLGYEPSLSLSLSAGTEAAAVNLDSLPIPTKPPKKKKDPKKLRAGGGKVWEDSTLDDWDPSRCLDN